MHWILIVRNLHSSNYLRYLNDRSIQPSLCIAVRNRYRLSTIACWPRYLTAAIFPFSHRSLLNIFSFYPSRIPYPSTGRKFVDDTSRKRGIFAVRAVRLEASLKRSNNAVEEPASNADAGLPFSPPSASTDIITDIMAGRPAAKYLSHLRGG